MSSTVWIVTLDATETAPAETYYFTGFVIALDSFRITYSKVGEVRFNQPMQSVEVGGKKVGSIKPLTHLALDRATHF